MGSDMRMLTVSPPRDQNNCQIFIYFLWSWFFCSLELHFGPLLNCNSLRSEPSRNWNNFLLSSESLRRSIKRKRTWKMKLCISSVRVNWCHRWPGTRVMEVWSLCEPTLSSHTWAHIAACFAWKPHFPKRKQGRIYGKQKKRGEKINFLFE